MKKVISRVPLWDSRKTEIIYQDQDLSRDSRVLEMANQPVRDKMTHY